MLVLVFVVIGIVPKGAVILKTWLCRPFDGFKNSILRRVYKRRFSFAELFFSTPCFEVKKYIQNRKNPEFYVESSSIEKKILNFMLSWILLKILPKDFTQKYYQQESEEKLSFTNSITFRFKLLLAELIWDLINRLNLTIKFTVF
jgi:hypothetical protein